MVVPTWGQNKKRCAGEAPGETGTAIEGGTSREIKEGDIVIIPAGTPHWFSKIDGSITYTVIRIDPNQILELQ